MPTIKFTNNEARSLDLLLGNTKNKNTAQQIGHNKIIHALASEPTHDHHILRLEPNAHLSPADVAMLLEMINFIEQCDYKHEHLPYLKAKLQILTTKLIVE